MRLTLMVLFMLTPVLAAVPGAQTLAARLALEAVPELNIVASSGDATQARYTLVSENGVGPVVGAVERHLLAEGWASHPSVSEPPNSGQVAAFVRADELLELRAAPAGRDNLVDLSLTLLTGGPPEQLADAP